MRIDDGGQIQRSTLRVVSEPPDRDAEMDDLDREVGLAGLTEAAERLDSLAEAAELMDDAAGAERLREAAAGVRLRAMKLLDGPSTD